MNNKCIKPWEVPYQSEVITQPWEIPFDPIPDRYRKFIPFDPIPDRYRELWSHRMCGTNCCGSKKIEKTPEEIQHGKDSKQLQSDNLKKIIEIAKEFPNITGMITTFGTTNLLESVIEQLNHSIQDGTARENIEKILDNKDPVIEQGSVEQQSVLEPDTSFDDGWVVPGCDSGPVFNNAGEQIGTLDDEGFRPEGSSGKFGY